MTVQVNGMDRAYRTILIAALCLAPSAALADDAPVWVRAARLYKTAMSPYSAKRYDQALPLLEQFVRMYGTNENVPKAYLQLAHCRAEAKDYDGWEEEIDTVIRRFRHSSAWFSAYRAKLGRLLGQEEHDEYLRVLEQFARDAKQLPLDFRREIESGVHWYAVDHRHPNDAPHSIRWLRPVFSEPDWERQLVKVADTPERAESVLRIIAPTLATLPDDLPTNWQYVHVELLRAAGKEDEAAEAFETYAEAWGDDPRGLDLWVRRARRLTGAKDRAGADAAWERILETYMGNASLSYALGERFEQLGKAGRNEEYIALAKRYLETYPLGNLRGGILNHWLAILRGRAVAGGEAERQAVAEFLTEHWGENSGFATRWWIDFHLDTDRPAKAVERARYYLDDKRWSSGTWRHLQQLARKHKAFEALVAEAEETYGIHDAAGKGEPVELLKELGGRIKDNQLRHMEEIGETLFREHRETDEAVTALSRLVDYYFKQVLTEQRDRWVNRMASAYPRHPATEAALRQQLTALQAQRRYEDLGETIDLYRARFPTAGLPFNYYNVRMHCYRAVKDDTGAKALRDRRVGSWRRSAERGNTRAMEEYFRARPELRGEEATSKARGDFWIEFADAHEGSRVELYCLRRAMDEYYYTPKRQGHLKLEPMPDDALKAIKRLQNQQLDPEIRWNLLFADVNLLFREERIDEGLKRLNEWLDGLERSEKVRDLAMRLSFGSIAAAMGDKRQHATEALEIVDKLRRHTFTTRDEFAVMGMEASVYWHAESYARAGKVYGKMVAEAPWPIAAYGWFRRSLECARRVSPAAMKSVADSYLARIPGCQDVAPGVLQEVGEYLLAKRHSAFRSVRGKLAERYPASGPRGALETEYAELLRKQ